MEGPAGVSGYVERYITPTPTSRMRTSPRYPTIGEAIRTIADALAVHLSVHEREDLRRLAREELDPARAATVEEGLIARLTESVPGPFRAWWGAVLKAEVAAYRHHVCDEPIGARTRAEAVLAWVEQRSRSWALPPALLHGLPAAPGCSPDLRFDGLLRWLSDAAGGSLGSLERAVERTRQDLEAGSLERKWRSWAAGTLPDRASIGELAGAGLRMPGADPIAPALIEARLLAARGFAYAQAQIEALWSACGVVAEGGEPVLPPSLGRVLTLSAPDRPKLKGDDDALATAVLEAGERARRVRFRSGPRAGPTPRSGRAVWRRTRRLRRGRRGRAVPSGTPPASDSSGGPHRRGGVRAPRPLPPLLRHGPPVRPPRHVLRRPCERRASRRRIGTLGEEGPGGVSPPVP